MTTDLDNKPSESSEQQDPPESPSTAKATAPAKNEPELKVVDRRWWAQGETPAAEVEAWQPRKPTYIEELERQLADKDQQLRDIIARYKAANDEFEGARLRLRREIGKDIERGKRTILTELLDVLDNLDRAIAAARTPSAGPHAEAAQPVGPVEGNAENRLKALLQGVEMVRDQFLTRLEGFGVRRMKALGAPFDPARHEAASTVPTTDPGQEDKVVGVIREGYQIGDEVLRPAVVAVARRG